jgi:hypothetical protein
VPAKAGSRNPKIINIEDPAPFDGINIVDPAFLGRNKLKR